jgi:hypothetical protein
MSIPVVDGRRFRVGKYDVVAQPIPGSRHMLRYTVFLKGTRIGALASVPTESDCRFLEKPPEVPPLKPFVAAYRPGRPKKAAAAAPSAERAPAPAREDLPSGLSLPDPRKTEES